MKKLGDYFAAARAQHLPVELENLKQELDAATAGQAARQPAAKTAFSRTRMAAIAAGVLVAIAVLTVSLYRLVPAGATRPEKAVAAREPVVTPPPGKAPEGAPAGETAAPAGGEGKPEKTAPAPAKGSNAKRPPATKRAEPAGKRLIAPFRLVQLPADVLRRLGVRVDQQGIHYQMLLTAEQTNGKPLLMWISIAGGKTVIGGNLDPGADAGAPTPADLRPLYFSDRYGKQLAGYRTAADDPRKLETDYFNKVLNSLLPVLVTAPNGKDEAIFWFRPSEALLAQLPPQLAGDIRQEYQRLLKAQSPAPAEVTPSGEGDPKAGKNTLPEAPPPAVAADRAGKTYRYFEAAGAGIASAREVSLFPNPAHDKVNLTFHLEQAQPLRILLADINGRTVREILPMQSFAAGSQLKSLSLADVPAGIYVLILESASGQKQTQRLIIQ